MPNLVGNTLSEYRILERIGAGGMGEVYLAEDGRLGRAVAIKVLSAELTRERSRVERFEREARAASALNHPNIVTVHTIGDSEHGRFIVMEHVEGRSLQDLIGEPMPLQALLPVARQIAEALVVAHRAGIVHRDIKPANVMLRNDGYVKIVDFGLVRLVSETRSAPDAATQTHAGGSPPPPKADQPVTRDGALIGTTAYMSPEQVRGEPVTAASDVFSFGILLYELTTGRHPFMTDSQVGTLHAVLSLSPIAPSRLRAGLPRELEDLTMRLLAKDARLRPTAAEVHQILSGLSERTVTEERTPIAVVRQHTVGRDREWAELRAAYQSAASGASLVACLVGEAGIGKTTLVNQFLAELETDSSSPYIGRGRCSERLAGTEAYLPILEVLESLAHSGTSDSVSQVLRTVAPTWYIQTTPLPATDTSVDRVRDEAKVASQERMKREFCALVAELSRAKTVVLALDDVHWADPATVDLLAYVSRRFDTARVLVIVTFRPSDLLLAEHPFGAIKLDLEARGLCREVPLGFLSASEVDRYLALEFPENAFPAELSRIVHERTEGSPLFMVDLVRYLRDRGVIAEQGDQWRMVASLPDLQNELPASVRSMVQRKIERRAGPGVRRGRHRNRDGQRSGRCRGATGADCEGICADRPHRGA